MASNRMPLLELIQKAGMDKDVDFLREGVRALAQALMEMEVSEKAGTGLYARSENRTAYRNGYRERSWDTRVGTIDLQIPKGRVP